VAERQHKVVLIGAKGYERTVDDRRVDCVQWSEIKKIKNIRDYDLVILNMLPLNKASTRDEVDWETFYKLLDFTSAMDILGNKGKIIVLGDPRLTMTIKSDQKDFLIWTGVDFVWDSEPGDTVIISESGYWPQFYDYMLKLKKWAYSLAFTKLNERIVSSRFDLNYYRSTGNRLSIHLNALCFNRYNHSLACQLTYRLMDFGITKESGPIIFLPEIDLSEDETIQLVLTSVCGIETNLPEPEWISGFLAPGQEEIDAEIARIDKEIKIKLAERNGLEKKRIECRELLKLLYEREFALEPIVRNILRSFGAEVVEPTENNKEDGWLHVNITGKVFEGVLEIKSTKSETFNDMGRKQLLDWIDRGRTLHNKEYKGIFIGNSSVDIPTSDRKNPFETNWVNAAVLSRICVIKTQDIYCIYLLKLKGLVDMDQFWNELFQTNGIFDMEKYLALLRN